MIIRSRNGCRIAIVLALFVLICCIHFASAEDSNRTVASNVTVTISNNYTVTESPIETIPVASTTEVTQNATLLQTIIPHMTVIISSAPTTQVEIPSAATTTAIPTGTTEISPVTTPTQVNETRPNVTITTKPVVQQKSLDPSVQRKISTNLLYIIDSNAPQTGLSRDAVQNQMETEGKLKSVMQTSSSSKNQGLRTLAAAATTQASNLVLVYIDLVPTASTTVVDAYVSSVTERNDQDHSVVAWVDINKLDVLASLDVVSNIRTAEPSVTKNSPVYHDTKFVNKRAGLPPLTAEGAKVSVREFENAPEMALEQKGTIKTPSGNVYEVASDSGRYFVNAKTGDVELASFYGKQKNSGPLSFLPKTTSTSTSSGSGPVTMDQAFAIAQDYARKNYRNFNDRTMVLTESELIDHGAGGKTYYNTWMETVNGVTVPNGVVVTVDADTGNVLSYIGIDQPVSADIVPSVSRNEAIGKAASTFSSITSVESDANLAVIFPDGITNKLVWSVDISGAPKDNVVQGGRVFIDAHSDEILKVNPFT